MTQNCVFIPPQSFFYSEGLWELTLALMGLNPPNGRTLVKLERRDVRGLASAPPALADRGLSLWWNDRQQEIRCPTSAEMQGRGSAEDGRRAIARVVVQERSAARELVLEVRHFAAAGAALFVIFAADGAPDAIAGRYHDAGRPNLDVQFDRLAFLQRLLLIVGVVGPERRRKLFIELAM